MRHTATPRCRTNRSNSRQVASAPGIADRLVVARSNRGPHGGKKPTQLTGFGRTSSIARLYRRTCIYLSQLQAALRSHVAAYRVLKAVPHLDGAHTRNQEHLYAVRAPATTQDSSRLHLVEWHRATDVNSLSRYHPPQNLWCRVRFREFKTRSVTSSLVGGVQSTADRWSERSWHVAVARTNDPPYYTAQGSRCATRASKNATRLHRVCRCAGGAG